MEWTRPAWVGCDDMRDEILTLVGGGQQDGHLGQESCGPVFAVPRQDEEYYHLNHRAPLAVVRVGLA